MNKINIKSKYSTINITDGYQEIKVDTESENKGYVFVPYVMLQNDIIIVEDELALLRKQREEKLRRILE